MTISEAYLLGRKDERERPTPLCNNPRSICVRCTERLKCPDADTGAYINGCENFNLTPISSIYVDVKCKRPVLNSADVK